MLVVIDEINISCIGLKLILEGLINLIFRVFSFFIDLSRNFRSVNKFVSIIKNL